MGKRLDVSCSVTLSYSEHGLLGRFKHRAGRKPQARMVARRLRPRLPDGRPRQGEGQAGLLPVLFGEEEAREADKARLALGPSARKGWEDGWLPPLPIGVILRILDWAAVRGSWGASVPGGTAHPAAAYPRQDFVNG